MEVFIPEADISKIAVGNEASVTLDAYGSGVTFKAKVASIDPGETIVEGVTTYRTILEFAEEDARIKSGMTANIDILASKRDGVISIPQRAISVKGGDKFARIISSDGTVKEVMIETGMRGSAGEVEVTKGVSEGDKVITSAP